MLRYMNDEPGHIILTANEHEFLVIMTSGAAGIARSRVQEGIARVLPGPIIARTSINRAVLVLVRVQQYSIRRKQALLLIDRTSISTPGQSSGLMHTNILQQLAFTAQFHLRLVSPLPIRETEPVVRAVFCVYFEAAC